ncbi:MAG: condensation domain-containing protein, partial [Frankia sp.]
MPGVPDGGNWSIATVTGAAGATIWPNRPAARRRMTAEYAPRRRARRTLTRLTANRHGASRPTRITRNWFSAPGTRQVERPTVEFAANGSSNPGLVGIRQPRRGAMADFHPLSYNQELMLAFGAEAGFGAAQWNDQVIFDLRQYVDADVREVLAQLSRRHEIMRTRVGLRAGQHCQVVDDQLDLLPHRVAALGHLNPDIVASTELATSFDLYDGPLFRSVALPRADGGAWLVLTLNHLISDLQSEMMLATEFAHRYELINDRIDARPAPDQYAHFARWQRAQVARYLRDPSSAPHWLEYEEAVRAMGSHQPARTNRARDTTSSPPGAARREAKFEFTAADMATMTAYCRTHKVTLNTVFLTALVTAISALPRLSIGLLLSEKTTRYPYRFAETLGPFPDLWPISRPVSTDADFPTVLASVHDQVLRAMEVHLPFHVLVGRTPWLAKGLQNDRRAPWIFYQFFSEASLHRAEYRRVAGINFRDTFGEQSTVFGIHLQLRLHDGLLHG